MLRPTRIRDFVMDREFLFFFIVLLIAAVLVLLIEYLNRCHENKRYKSYKSHSSVNSYSSVNSNRSWNHCKECGSSTNSTGNCARSEISLIYGCDYSPVREDYRCPACGNITSIVV